MIKKQKKKTSKKVSQKAISKSKKVTVKAIFSGDDIVSSSKEARDLYSQSVFGEYINGKIHYSFVEALYLVDRSKISVYYKSKNLKFSELIDKCKLIDSKILAKFLVYKDLRNRGYLLKTALKFGADFRVYEKGIKPGKDHSKWLLYCVSEASEMTWHDFSAKNRVAHSTNKNLLIAVVDSEGGITYYEVAWKRP